MQFMEKNVGVKIHPVLTYTRVLSPINLCWKLYLHIHLMSENLYFQCFLFFFAIVQFEMKEGNTCWFEKEYLYKEILGLNWTLFSVWTH